MYDSFVVSSSQMGRAIGPARYFRVMQAVSESVRCRFIFDDDVLETEIPAGVGIPFSVPFKEVHVWGYGADEEVKVMTHVLPIQDDRLNVSGPIQIGGVVSVDPVADEQFDRFARSVYSSAAAGLYQYHEYHNPVGSGVDVYFEELEAWMPNSSTVGGILLVSGQNSPPPTAVGATVSLDNEVKDSKLLTGKFNISQYYQLAYTAVAQSQLVRLQGARYAQEIKPKSPIRVKEGGSLIFFTTSVATIIGVRALWEERPNV